MTTAAELKTWTLARADEDSDFRARLNADSNGAISAETGTTIAQGLDVVVHEDSATTAHLVLPPSPRLTEAEMEAVAGGVGFADWNPFPPSQQSGGGLSTTFNRSRHTGLRGWVGKLGGSSKGDKQYTIVTRGVEP